MSFSSPNSLLQRSSITKAATSGVALGLANKFIAKQDLNIKQVGLQAGCSYVAPAVTDKVAPMIGAGVPFSAFDAVSTGVLYSGSSGYLGVDARSFLFKFLYSAGSDYAADYTKAYLPKF